MHRLQPLTLYNIRSPFSLHSISVQLGIDISLNTSSRGILVIISFTVWCTVSQFAKIIWCSRWFCPPPPHFRQCVALFRSLFKECLLLYIGWFVLFFKGKSNEILAFRQRVSKIQKWKAKGPTANQKTSQKSSITHSYVPTSTCNIPSLVNSTTFQFCPTWGTLIPTCYQGYFAMKRQAECNQTLMHKDGTNNRTVSCDGRCHPTGMVNRLKTPIFPEQSSYQKDTYKFKICQ